MSFTPKSRIYVAGHTGLLGSALVRKLREVGCANVVLRTHSELELTDQSAVRAFFKENAITHVFLAAAKVGGIVANASQQAEFLYQNLSITSNVIHAAHEFGIEKLFYPGSSCLYPKHAPQPMPENSILTGPFEPTNEGTSVAKLAALKLCEIYNRQYKKPFIAAIPANLYGPGDNFHPTHSHFLPGLLRRFHEAKAHGKPEVAVWGTGTPRRELLHVDDAADAILFLMKNYDSPDLLNIGTGTDHSLAEIAEMVKEIVGFQGKIIFDTSKPDGAPRKLLESSRMEKLGWRPKLSLMKGLRSTYQWALENRIF